MHEEPGNRHESERFVNLQGRIFNRRDRVIQSFILDEIKLNYRNWNRFCAT